MSKLLGNDNMQEMFNIAVAGVIAQGAPSVQPDAESCAYRDGKGNKCAVGHLMTEEVYREVTAAYCDTSGITSATLRNLLGLPCGISRPHFGDPPVSGLTQFLHELQKAHDRAAFGEDFLGSFAVRARAVARNWNLDASAVDAALAARAGGPQ